MELFGHRSGGNPYGHLGTEPWSREFSPMAGLLVWGDAAARGRRLPLLRDPPSNLQTGDRICNRFRGGWSSTLVFGYV